MLMILVAVFGVGAIGGLVNSLVSGSLQLPGVDHDARVYRPGWVGNVIVGGIAALVFWALYGPLAEAVIIGPGNPGSLPSTTLADLAGSLLTGLGGGRLLTAEVDRHALTKENDALRTTRDILANSVRKALGGGP